jgi:sirohydrochlorin cobaltochelatase
VTQALVLFAHGARDARWAVPFERLRARVAELLPAADVVLAFLERMEPDLAQACAGLIAAGRLDILIVPVFLGEGAHVREDLPAQIEMVRRAYPLARVQYSKAVGEDDTVIEALARFCASQLQAVNP